MGFHELFPIPTHPAFYEERELSTAVPEVAGAVAVEASVETETSDSILASLSPEKQEKAEALKQTMAEKFGLKPEDFGLVKILSSENEGVDSEPKVVVMLTSCSGLYMGSYNKVMDKESDEDFIIEVDGETIDTREAMIWDVYEAFIEQTIVTGVNPLPDSEVLSRQRGELRTTTWLTGEPADKSSAECGNVNFGKPNRGLTGRNFDGEAMRVRPAAEV